MLVPLGIPHTHLNKIFYRYNKTEKKSRYGGLTLFNSKIYYKATVSRQYSIGKNINT